MGDSGRVSVAACGTKWHVAYLLFSVINGGEEVDAPATQAQITSHNKTLKLIRKEMRVRDVIHLIIDCH